MKLTETKSGRSITIIRAKVPNDNPGLSRPSRRAMAWAARYAASQFKWWKRTDEKFFVLYDSSNDSVRFKRNKSLLQGSGLGHETDEALEWLKEHGFKLEGLIK